MERRGLDRLFPPLPFFLELRGPGIVDASRNERATSVTGIACRNGPVSVTLVFKFQPLPLGSSRLAQRAW